MCVNVLRIDSEVVRYLQAAVGPLNVDTSVIQYLFPLRLIPIP